LVAQTDHDDPIIIKQFEEMGAAQLRLQMQTAQFPTSLNSVAFKWLKRKDEELLAANEASQALQIATARSANKAAWIAAIAAIAAAVLAIVSIIMTVLMWLDPHGS
jgi:hypothetical protein